MTKEQFITKVLENNENQDKPLDTLAVFAYASQSYDKLCDSIITEEVAECYVKGVNGNE